jgi:competence protein ComEC
VALAYAALTLVAMGSAAVARRVEPAAAARRAAWRRLPLRRRRAAVALVALGIALAAARLVATPAPPGRLTVSFLDVGQGDATLVQHPDGSAVLFDGGPPEGRVWRLLRKSGVRRLTAVVATHASRDHHGGLRRVIEDYPVDLLLDGGDGTRDPDFRSLLAAADRRGVRRMPATAPLTVRAGALSVRVVSPSPRPPGPPPEDPNPRAVVAIVSAGELELFLSADAESPSLLPLELPDVDAMKVPHHGSSDPGLPELLARLRPEIAAIEVGANSYGHPTGSTLAALRNAGARTYRTDRDGTVRLTLGGGGMRVGTER